MKKDRRIKTWAMLLIGIPLTMACQHAPFSQELNETVLVMTEQNKTRLGESTMIEAKQALELALKASSQRLDQNTIANIIVEPIETYYRVSLLPFAPADKPAVEGLVIQIDADNGSAKEIKVTSSPNPLKDLKKDIQSADLTTGLQAYQAALNAIKGYDHYDKYGRLEISLEHDHYKVSFPDPGARDGQARSADYTYQVWIDAITGEVLKILAGS